MVESASGIYLAWNVFEDYANQGSLILKATILYALNRLLPNKTLNTDLPAQGVTTLQEQKQEKRLVHHLLYASPVRRGKQIEVIEDIIPLYDGKVSIQTTHQVKNVYLETLVQSIPLKSEEGSVSYTVPKLECHQMVVIDYE